MDGAVPYSNAFLNHSKLIPHQHMAAEHETRSCRCFPCCSGGAFTGDFHEGFIGLFHTLSKEKKNTYLKQTLFKAQSNDHFAHKVLYGTFINKNNNNKIK